MTALGSLRDVYADRVLVGLDLRQRGVGEV